MIRTAVLKLHNPSQHKRAVLDYAFKHYTLALQRALDLAQENLERLHDDCHRSGRFSTNALHSAVSHIFSEKAFKLPVHSSLRDSLIAKVTSMLASYFELCASCAQKTTKFPRGRRYYGRETLYEEALEGLRLAMTKEEEDLNRDMAALACAPDAMPLDFSRSDGGAKKRSRNFGLMKNPATGRYSALLFLLPSGSKYGRPIGDKESPVVNVRTPQEHFVPTRKMHSAILCPLAFGDWHIEEFIEKGDPKTAFLCRRSGEYFIHISFQLPDPDPVQTETLLGVDRGIANIAAMAVVTQDGKQVLASTTASGARLSEVQVELFRRRQQMQRKGQTFTSRERKAGRFADNVVHEVANSIVKTALEHRSQVVVEKLSRFNTPGLIRKQQYGKVLQALSYKLPAVGLPAPREVPAAYTSQTCAACGSVSKEHRLSQADFACSECGHKANADINAAINIARKHVYLELRRKEAKGGVPENERTTWPEFARYVPTCRDRAG